MKRILILESNEAFANELSAHFSHEGYDVCAVTGDGAEGLKLLEKHSPKVVVMSLLLKTCDGFTVMEEARAHGRKADFIVTGNFSDDKIISRTIALGARYYLMKPVSAALVEERVAEILQEGTPKAEKFERRRAGSLDERISGIFISIGIPPHIKGYGYLREGIKMAVNDPRIINNVTKGLYPIIGEKFGTSASKVERAIRHAIEVAWNRGRVDAVNAIFGARVYIGSEKPTNSEFIALVADKLILESMV
ncbi:MAG: sporulation transcription factor Spo0A [Clostridia bacterium]|nr:sporulation transcription factor Spo0A [Clostridia bacterium]